MNSSLEKKHTEKIPLSIIKKRLYRDRYLYFMFIPVILYYVIFKYVPMYGLVAAFQDFKINKGFSGSEWVGLEHFSRLFQSPEFFRYLKNTLVLNLYGIIFMFPIPILLAIFINDIPGTLYKKAVQSALYIPHFMSWVVLGGIIISMLSPSTGIINTMLEALGFEKIFFMADPKWWVVVYVASTIWQGAGWGTIIYLSALTNIDPALYEASRIDGADKLRQIWHITLPGIRSTIAVTLILKVGQMMDVGFEHIYALQNNNVLNVSEVISTYVYRLGIMSSHPQYSYTTAIGFFQSVIALILITTTNKVCKMLGESSLW